MLNYSTGKTFNTAANTFYEHHPEPLKETEDITIL